jgi:radical SAM superfamily enzyme YgiQ (UPF0313 family)
MAEPPPLPGPGRGIERRSALLINPFYAKDPHGSFGKHVLTPTLALTSLAAATPDHWRVRYWDENLLQGALSPALTPEVVGITVHLTSAGRAYALADAYRQHGAKVALGGLHVHSCPDEAMPHADAVALGDGVVLWPEILRDVERRNLRPRYVAGFEGAYAIDPPPRRELVPRRSFLTTASVIATRGCRNRCGFCYHATDGLRLPYRTRPVTDIAAQAEASGQPYVVFMDNNLGAHPSYVRALGQALRPLGKIWSAAVTPDVTDDPRLVRDMAQSGCVGVFIGFETLSDSNLAQARKRSPRVADYARRVRILHEHGIAVNGSFIVGFDDDRKDVFQATLQWIEEQRLACATFHILTPYPGTPLFRQFEAEGRLLHRDWSRYDTAHAVFRPRHLTPGELELGYDWMYRRLFSPGSVWRRRPADVLSVMPCLAGALLYKRANPLWLFLIRHQLVHLVWRPFIQWTRWRHQAQRRRSKAPCSARKEQSAVTTDLAVSAGV